MTPMKPLELLLACLLALALPAFGQVPGTIATTNAIPAVSTNTANAEIAVGEASEVALQMTFNLAASVGVNSNITATLERSVNGVNWVTWTSISLTANGTSTVSFITNIAIGAVPRLRIGPIINANTAAVQNLAFDRASKRSR